MSPPPFDKSVFINCPFDETYRPLFQTIVFTSYVCGFTPRCALEFEGDPLRIRKIIDVIHECQFGIHDISIPDGRLNMPLELGLFMGCQVYGDARQNTKSYLILEGAPFSSKKYLSDLAGVDPKAHENDKTKLIDCVREWLASKATSSHGTIPHSPYIVNKYSKFQKELPKVCAKKNWVPEKLLFPEYLSLVSAWTVAKFQ